ncbi:MAG: hypothetical protein AAGA56_07400 [Myxococcota bacterium]
MLVRTSLAIAVCVIGCGRVVAPPPSPPAPAPPAASAERAEPASAAPISSSVSTDALPSPDGATLAGPPGPTLDAKMPLGQVVLVDSGAAPRRALRYAAPPPKPELIEMTLSLTMTVRQGMKAAPRMQVPPVVATLELAGNGTDENGDLKGIFTVRGLDMKLQGPPEKLSAIRQGLKRVVGMKGDFVRTSRGEIKNAKMRGDAQQDAMLKQGFEQAIAFIAAPFPREPVGVGARWVHTTKVEQREVTLTQQTRFELVALKAEEATVAVSLIQQAPAQPIQTPDGQKVQLLSMMGRGNNKQVLRLDRLAPVGSTSAVTTQMKLEVKTGGDQVLIKTDVRTDVAAK